MSRNTRYANRRQAREEELSGPDSPQETKTENVLDGGDDYYYVNAGVEPNSTKVITRSDMVNTACLVVSQLGDEVAKDLLDKSCFGHLLKIQWKNLKVSGQLIHAVMYKAVEKVGNVRRDQIDFRIGSSLFSFTRKEFALISGLRFGEAPTMNPNSAFDLTRSNRIRLKRLYLGTEKLNISRVELEHAFNTCDVVVDKVKLGLLCILFSGLLAKQSTKPIELKYVQLVDNLDAFNNYPWGTVVYDATISELLRVSKEQIRTENPKKGYTLCGFPIAFQVWLYETIPLVSKLGFAIKQEPQRFPRILNWESSGTPFFENFVNTLINVDPKCSFQIVDLLPCDEEKRKDYWQSVSADLSLLFGDFQDDLPEHCPRASKKRKVTHANEPTPTVEPTHTGEPTPTVEPTHTSEPSGAAEANKVSDNGGEDPDSTSSSMTMIVKLAMKKALKGVQRRMRKSLIASEERMKKYYDEKQKKMMVDLKEHVTLSIQSFGISSEERMKKNHDEKQKKMMDDLKEHVTSSIQSFDISSEECMKKYHDGKQKQMMDDLNELVTSSIQSFGIVGEISKPSSQILRTLEHAHPDEDGFAYSKAGNIGTAGLKAMKVGPNREQQDVQTSEQNENTSHGGTVVPPTAVDKRGEYQVEMESTLAAPSEDKQSTPQELEIPISWPPDGKLRLPWVTNLMSVFDWASRNLPPTKFPSVLPFKVCKDLLHSASRILHKEPNCVVVDQLTSDSTVVVVGDLHGQLHDLLFLLHDSGYPSENQVFVFNGDYVDRGAWGLESFLLLLAWKILLPKNVYLLRGNHESKYCTSVYGFEKEVLAKYGEDGKNVYTKCLWCFEGLPLASIIANNVYTAHGGLFRSMPVRPKMAKGKKRRLALNPEQCDLSLGDLDELKKARRLVLDPPCEGWNLVPGDVMWSDPSMSPGLAPNEERGIGLLWGPDCTEAFLKKSQLKLIIRSHEGPDAREKRPGFGGMDEGYTIDHIVESGNLITLFSAPDYPQFQATDERYRNKGAYIVLNPPSFDIPIFHSFEAIAPRPKANPFYDFEEAIDSDQELDLPSMVTTSLSESCHEGPS